jgi:hypothetical protein
LKEVAGEKESTWLELNPKLSGKECFSLRFIVNDNPILLRIAAHRK